VRNTVLATAVAAILGLAAAPEALAEAKGTATRAEVQAIEAQMQALAERLNKLEAANTVLQSENQQLKSVVDRREAEIDYLKAQTRELREEGAVTSNEISKVKGADWATRIKFKGDLRLRHETIQTERVVSGEAVDAADRHRPRYRARFGFDAKVTDNVKAVMQIASGGIEPRSSNQTFGVINSRKEIGLDLAYIDWRFANGVNLIAGKVKYPFWRPGQSLFFDGDVNPEGLAVAFDRGMFFGSAYGWMIDENYNSNPAGNNADTILLGAQFGAKFALFGGETRVAAHYYDLGGGQYSDPFLLPGLSFGNSLCPQGSVQVLCYDYNVGMLSAEMGLMAGELPLSLWADYAQNFASDVEYDTAYGFGATLGKARNPGTWEVGIFYQSVDKDALFAQFVDSDWNDGNTDGKGWGLKAGYAPVKNVTLNGTYYNNTRNKDVGTQLDYQRLQLDVNYKF
jgi:hypothetical protein